MNFTIFVVCKDNQLIKPETIQRIIETARIDEVVSDFVSLKKRGANYIGLCPFHNEKTPSFHVSPSKGIFKCFGCSKGGDSVRFIMEHEHYSYVEALRFLAEKYHIDIEEVEMTSKMKEELSEKESLFAIHQFAQKYFADILFNHDEGKQIALPYFKERQFTLETIKKFKLGFCLSSWDAFTKEAIENGYTHQQLVKSGIVIEKDGKYFDRFRERVIFPIHNISGRILGFGGRILTSDKSKAKYLNSPETDIYSKSKVLYGLHFSKNAIVKEDNCLLVEGYTDVLSMHQSGIENVVSSSGTALTVDQIRLIKKYTTNITIIYDGDPAGIKASLRGIGLVLAEDMNVKIVLLPEPEDPDSFVKKNRTAEVKRYFEENAKNFILFKSNLLLSEAKSDPIKKAAVISEIVEDISLIPNNISRSIYIKECSSIFDIPENSLIGQLNKLLARRLKKNIQRQNPQEDTSGNEFMPEVADAPKQVSVDYYNAQYQELAIVHLLINYGHLDFNMEVMDEEDRAISQKHNIADFVFNDFKNDEIELSHPLYNKMYELYKFIHYDARPDKISFFTSHEDKEVRQLSIDLMSFPYTISKEWENKFEIFTSEITDENSEVLNDLVISVLMKLKLRNIEIEIHNLEEKLKLNPPFEDALDIMTSINMFTKIRNMLCDKLNIIITH